MVSAPLLQGPALSSALAAHWGLQPLHIPTSGWAELRLRTLLQNRWEMSLSQEGQILAHGTAHSAVSKRPQLSFFKFIFKKKAKHHVTQQLKAY